MKLLSRTCVILTDTISGLTPSERNSLNRDCHDFCVNVKTFLELFVMREKQIILRDSILQRGIGDPGFRVHHLMNINQSGYLY